MKLPAPQDGTTQCPRSSQTWPAAQPGPQVAAVVAAAAAVGALGDEGVDAGAAPAAARVAGLHPVAAVPPAPRRGRTGVAAPSLARRAAHLAGVDRHVEHRWDIHHHAPVDRHVGHAEVDHHRPVFARVHRHGRIEARVRAPRVEARVHRHRGIHRRGSVHNGLRVDGSDRVRRGRPTSSLCRPPGSRRAARPAPGASTRSPRPGPSTRASASPAHPQPARTDRHPPLLRLPRWEQPGRTPARSPPARPRARHHREPVDHARPVVERGLRVGTVAHAGDRNPYSAAALEVVRLRRRPVHAEAERRDARDQRHGPGDLCSSPARGAARDGTEGPPSTA